MLTVKQVVDIAKQAKQLHEFVTGGELADYLGELDFAAAKDALNKSKVARDPRAQVWSAITHLESAHASFASMYRGKITNDEWSFYGKPLADLLTIFMAAQKDYMTLFMMAICYKFLGEKELCKQILADLRTSGDNAPDFFNSEKGAHWAWIVPQLLDPRVYYRYNKIRKYPDVEISDIIELERSLDDISD